MLVQFFECSPGSVVVTVGLVDEVEVDVVDVEEFEGSFNGRLGVVVALVVNPQFCGDENVFARDVTGADGFSDGVFILI